VAEVLEDADLRRHMSAAGIREACRFRAPAVTESLLEAYSAALAFAQVRSGVTAASPREA
jgi:hypothetical protein